MQFRSIVSLFVVLCLVIVAFFGNVVESEKVVENPKRSSTGSNKNSALVQRLKRQARNTDRRPKRAIDDLLQDNVGSYLTNSVFSSDSSNDQQSLLRNMNPSDFVAQTNFAANYQAIDVQDNQS